jgi:hypothetical protein
MPGLAFNAEAPAFCPEFHPMARPRIDLSMRADAAEFIPIAGGWATLQSASEAYSHNKKRQMPLASDEEWETRITKREKEVETIKSLQSYRLYVEVFPHDQREEEDPKTPDPRDRSVSKRMWKWNVEKWRLQLKGRCVYSRNILIQCRELLQRRDLEAGRLTAGGSSASQRCSKKHASSVDGVRERLARLPTPSQRVVDVAQGLSEIIDDTEWSIGPLQAARVPAPLDIPEPPGIPQKADGAAAAPATGAAAAVPLSAIGPGTFQ